MVNYEDIHIGASIRSLRLQRGLSQEVLSGLACIARSHLSMIENGTKQPNLETIWKLAGALDMPPHKLIEIIENNAKSN